MYGGYFVFMIHVIIFIHTTVVYKRERLLKTEILHLSIIYMHMYEVGL